MVSKDDEERIGLMIERIRKNKAMIWDLAVNDFAIKYAGSYFGIFWAFVQPIITILVYWCVFEYGLKSTAPIPNVSYIVWFATGMIPWFFFSDAVNAVTNSFIEYSYLVKKVVFDIEFLPIVKIISNLFIHLFFVGLLVIISLANGQKMTLHFIEVFYYMLCLILFAYAIGKITSSIIVFFKDLGQIVNIVLQIGLWVTPIIWSYIIVPEKFQWIVKLNPVFYIVEGYRDSFIEGKWFFQKPLLTVYFWLFTSLLLIIGKVVFKKLKPHFADVL